MVHHAQPVLVILPPLYKLVVPVHALDLHIMPKVVLMAPVPAQLRTVEQLLVLAVFRQIDHVPLLAVHHLQQIAVPMLAGQQLVIHPAQVILNVPVVITAVVIPVSPRKLMANLVPLPVNVPVVTV